MKRTGLFLATLALLGLSACATKEYVRTQTDPLAERITRLEEKQAQLNGMRESDAAAVKQATDKAQQAMDLSNKTACDVKNANNEVKRAEEAAVRAEKAAAQAGQSASEAREMAQKSEKIFKLGQKK